MTKFVPAAVAFAAITSLAGAASAEDVTIKGSVTDMFGHRAVVQSADSKKFLVNFGPKVKDVALKAGDAVTIDGDLKKNGEVHVFNVTLADGRKVEISKDKLTWREWLLGEDKDTDKHFTADDAKAVAAGKGYALTSDLTAEKKHFVAAATKDGKAVEIEVHPDGSVKEAAPFTSDDAKKNITAKGYEVVGQPAAMKKHFEALAKKDNAFYEVHAHRDGEVKEMRKVEKGDARWGAQIP